MIPNLRTDGYWQTMKPLLMPVFSSASLEHITKCFDDTYTFLGVRMFRILTVVPIPCAFTIFLPQTKMPYSILSLKSNRLMPLWFTMHEAKIPNSFALTNRLIRVFLFFICSPQATYQVSVMIWIRSYNGTKVQIG